ncbi:hypothetical protein NQZ68_024670, partial [Dissostichus eleginoides]
SHWLTVISNSSHCCGPCVIYFVLVWLVDVTPARSHPGLSETLCLCQSTAAVSAARRSPGTSG